jgi:hypothetical protein
MDVDFRENIAKIIENKLKQIKTQAEFYENRIRSEIKRVIEIEERIKKLKIKKEENNLEQDNIKNEEIDQAEFKISEIKKVIRDLRHEKKKVLECDINVQFNDDLNIKSEFDLN